ncbi:trimeric intracellular cation channel family protein [Thiomicrorhabdus indica]|uniref:trimeric intracellular cation channel family protein n=1 Tax=Thiomicrorhabdus indica TaxID=2267253 RepID=UPI002AA73145|nr:trimeric intracellular cation channel family protein [Thiomicrorhabdus indica]
MAISILIHYLDILGTVVFTITGLLAARYKRLDLFGAIVIAMVTAIGGGTVRDLIIDEPVFWTQNDFYIYLVVITALIFFFLARFKRLPIKMLVLLDALGLAVFTVIGTQKALELGFSDPIAIMTGVMTGVVGGMIRDVLVGEMPLVLRKEIYATASFFGASALLLLDQWNVSLDIAILVSIVITLSLRVLAIIYTIELPVFVSYQPKIPNSEGSKEAKNDANQSDSKNESNNLY